MRAIPGSTRARLILDHWCDYKQKFRKVMPVEYRRAIEEMTSWSKTKTELTRATVGG